jgi:hypothetical protein
LTVNPNQFFTISLSAQQYMKRIILLFAITLASLGTYAQSSNLDAKSITAAKYADQAAIDAVITSPEEGV